MFCKKNKCNNGCHFLLGLADKNGQSFMDAASVGANI